MGDHESGRTAGRGLLLLVAAGATFLAMLDATVANLAIPDLRTDFPDASVADLSWVITAYAVPFAAVLTPAGRLADIVGRRRLYAWGVGFFTLLSLGCALAPNVPALAGLRAAQGIGAAAMVPASLAIVLGGVPAAGRARAIGLWSAAGAVAAAVGPSLGGLLIDALGWRSVFLINVPIGIALLALLGRAVPAPAAPAPSDAQAPRRLPDLFGAVLLAVGIGGVVLGLTEGSNWGWDDGRTLGCLAGGAVLVAAALWRSTRHPVPAVETSLWRHPTFVVANITSLLYGAALYSWLLVGVLYVTEVWDYSELEAGLAMSPGAITAALAAVTVGRIVGRRGPRGATVFGLLLLAGVGLWIGLWMPTEPQFLALWLPGGLVVGIGMGAVSTGTSTAAALSGPPARFAGTTGLNTAARQVGGALGIAGLAAIRSSSGSDVLGGLTNVYYACTAVAVAAAFAALWLRLRLPGAGSPSAQARPAAAPDRAPQAATGAASVTMAATRGTGATGAGSSDIDGAEVAR